MSTILIIILIIAAHIIGALCMIIYCKKTGILKFAKKYGDGIRCSTPSDVIFKCITVWEIILFARLIEIIDNKIDNVNW